MEGKICLVTGANAGIGKATALGLAERGARVVIVSRDRERGRVAQAEIKRHSGSELIDLLLADLSLQAAYAQSKLANVLFTYELARRLAGTGVTANCLHPGVIRTKLSANYAGRDLAAEASPAELERGAQTSVYLATSPEVEGVSGKYFVNQRQARSSPASHDQRLAQSLWQISAELARLL